MIFMSGNSVIVFMENGSRAVFPDTVLVYGVIEHCLSIYDLKWAHSIHILMLYKIENFIRKSPANT